MKQLYEKSIQMIKAQNRKLTVREYNELAKEHDLLCSESLKFISGKDFQELVRSLKEAWRLLFSVLEWSKIEEK